MATNEFLLVVEATACLGYPRQVVPAGCFVHSSPVQSHPVAHLLPGQAQEQHLAQPPARLPALRWHGVTWGEGG